MNLKFYTIVLSSLALIALPSCIVPSNFAHTSSPLLNTSIRVLPHGYRTVHVGGSPYYYAGNSWYRRNSYGYTRVSRPHNYYGSIGRSTGYSRGISRLPSGYRAVSYNGASYYTNGSSWYQRRGNQYYQGSRPTNYRTSYRKPTRTTFQKPVVKKAIKATKVSAPLLRNSTKRTLNFNNRNTSASNAARTSSVSRNSASSPSGTATTDAKKKSTSNSDSSQSPQRQTSRFRAFN